MLGRKVAQYFCGHAGFLAEASRTAGAQDVAGRGLDHLQHGNSTFKDRAVLFTFIYFLRKCVLSVLVIGLLSD